MSSGANYGIKKSVPHLLGINVGFPLMVIIVGLGFGSALLSYPAIYPVIKTAGISYLLFLAWKIAHSSAPGAVGNSKPLTFIQALLFQWVNPKAWVMAIGAIASFTSVEKYLVQMLVIFCGYVVVGGLCMFFWLAVGVSLQKVLQKERHFTPIRLTDGKILLFVLYQRQGQLCSAHARAIFTELLVDQRKLFDLFIACFCII